MCMLLKKKQPGVYLNTAAVVITEIKSINNDRNQDFVHAQELHSVFKLTM